MATITKTLSQRKDAAGCSEVLFRFSAYRGCVLRCKTGIYVKASLWDTNKSTLSIPYEKHKVLNDDQRRVKHDAESLVEKINALTHAILSAYDNENDKTKINSEWIKTEVDKFHNPDKYKLLHNFTFEQAYKHFITTQSVQQSWAPGTIKKHRQVLRYILNRDNNIDLHKIDNDYMNGIVDTMVSEGKINSTIRKQLGYLRWFLKFAFQNGYTNNNIGETYSVDLKQAKKFVITLTQEELDKVYRIDLGEDEALSMVRDVFCFCANTGLRFSDVNNLKKENIVNKEIHLVAIKDGDALTIPLNDVALEILNRYKNRHFKNNKVLPVISNQKTNNHLKVLGKKCELTDPIIKVSYCGGQRIEQTYEKWQLLSTHVGRKTFISRCIALGIPPAVIMQWTGHSDFKAMEPYINLDKSVTREYMSRLNKDS